MTVYEYLQVDPDAPTPLGVQLSQQLAWLIASGELKEDDLLPPVRKLAEYLDINLHTVRAAYRQLEASGLVVTRQGRGTIVLPYDRQRVAGRAPTLRTFTIGVLIPEYAPFYAPFLRGLEDAAQADPSLLFICNTHEYTRHVSRYLDQLIAKNADGIIITSGSPGSPDLKAILDHPEMLPPIVSADSPGMPGPGVLFDLEGGGFQATTHLIEHGHRRIGLIAPPLEAAQVSPVYRGYERALRSAGLTPQPDWVATGPDYSLESGAQAAAHLLDLPEPPAAIFAASDLLAIGAMRVIKARGLTIPKDVALVGFNDIEMAALTDPPLTIVSLPAYDMGFAAMTMLSTLIAGQAVEPPLVTLEGQLVIRRSCGCG